MPIQTLSFVLASKYEVSKMYYFMSKNIEATSFAAI